MGRNCSLCTSLDWDVRLLSEHTPTQAQRLLGADLSLRAKGKKEADGAEQGNPGRCESREASPQHHHYSLDSESPTCSVQAELPAGHQDSCLAGTGAETKGLI